MPKQRVWTLVKSPAVITLIVSLIILITMIVFIGQIRPFNSDDLYWQQVVRTWAPFGDSTLYLATKDTFVELIPFFWVMEHIFSPSRELLIAEVIILTSLSFIFIYITALYFMKKLKIKQTYSVLLPFVWLASFGFPMVENYLNSNWRTFEFGISFLTFLLAAAICMGDFKPLQSTRNKILSFLATIYMGIVAFSDPYYVYFTFGPIAIFAGLLFLWKKIKRKELFIIYGGIALSMIFAVITDYLFKKMGVTIVTETPSLFVNFDNILTNIVASLHGLLIIFGADFFGRPAMSIATAGYAINALILGFIVYKAFTWRRTFKQQIPSKLTQPQLWVLFFVLVVVNIFIVYTSSTLALVSNYRFYILGVCSFIVFLVLILGLTKNNKLKNTATVVIVLATLFNVSHILFTDHIRSRPNVANNIGNSLNATIIRAIEAEGLTKGYASYWQGNVNTYFSNGKVAFLPTLCIDSHTKPFKWLIDGSLYDRRAEKSFYLIDPDIPHPQICTKKQLEKQFGKPEKVFTVANNKSVLVYNYDIGTKLDQNWLAH